MTTTPDLTSERLDELERELDAMDVARVDIDWPKHTRRALVAMAKAKQAAEQERDSLREVLGSMVKDWTANAVDFRERAAAALAQPTDAGGA